MKKFALGIALSLFFPPQYRDEINNICNKYFLMTLQAIAHGRTGILSVHSKDLNARRLPAKPSRTSRKAVCAM